MDRYEKRFWANVNKTSGCWLWTGKVLKNRAVAGQPQARFYASVGTTRFFKAANYSWYLHNGLNVDGLHVCHTCDNSICVNPDHLFLGTHQDNMDDKVAKGRQARGEGHGRAKLTESDVMAIRCGDMPDQEWADRFGVSVSAIYNARTGRRWTYLPLPTEGIS